MSRQAVAVPLLATAMLVAPLWATTSQAAEPVDLAREAEALARQGDMEGALTRMRAASEALWDLQPFVLKSAGLAGDVAGGEPVTLQAGETLSVAANVSGFGYGGTSSALTVDFAVDLSILHESGQVLATREGFATISQAVPRRLADFTVELSVATPALRDGTYQAVFTLRDLNGRGSEDFSIDFAIDGIAR